MFHGLHGLFHVPHEGTQPQFGTFCIKRTQAFKQRSHALVGHYGEYGRRHGGPRMRAVVRLAVDASASLYSVPRCETATTAAVEYVDYALAVSLVECYLDMNTVFIFCS